MTPAPRTAIVSCSAIRLPYTIYVRRETGLPCNGFASSIRTPPASRRASSSPAGRTSAAAARRARSRVFRDEFDAFRSAVVNEPRGSDVWSARCCASRTDADCAAGVIFFNNVGYLGMCGHGTIGLVATLAHLGRIAAGRAPHRDAGRRRRRELHADGRRRRSATCRATASAKGVDGRRARASARCAATSPGAATGSSWSTTHGGELALDERRGADRLHLARAPGR